MKNTISFSLEGECEASNNFSEYEAAYSLETVAAPR